MIMSSLIHFLREKLMRFLCIIFLLFVDILAFGQTAEPIAEREFTPQQLRNDFAIVCQSLKEIHPSMYSFITEDSVNRLTQAISTELSHHMTELEFQVVLRKFIRHIRCGHTTARPSAEWYLEQAMDSKLLPFDVIVLDHQLFIKEAYDQEIVLTPGTEILTIDHRPSHEIIHEMWSIQEVDGFSITLEDKKIERLFKTYHLFLFGRSDEYEVEYANEKNEKQCIIVKGGVQKPKASLPTVWDEAGITTEGAKFYVHEEMDDLAVLDINNFASRGYRKFYKTVFKEINRQEINHLVIDLRGNGGGYFPNGYRLLRYLLKDTYYMKFSRPKNKLERHDYLSMGWGSRLTRRLFGLMPDKDKANPDRNYQIRYQPIKKNPYNGKLYVFIDGGSFSMGSLVASRLNRDTDAIIFGEETGGGEYGSNAILMYNLVLPETKIRIFIPYYFLNHDIAVEMPGRGVIPNIELKYTLNDKLQQKDKEMEQLQILRNSK